MNTIFALDPSLNGSGAIIGDTRDGIMNYYYFSNLKSDHKNSHCIPIDKDTSSTDKLDNLICWYLSQASYFDYMVMESPALYGSNANDNFKYMYGIIQYLNRRLGIPTLMVTPISLKLYATDNARAEKYEMVEVAYKAYGNKIDFDNVSKKHREDLADVSHLFNLCVDYIKCKDCIYEGKYRPQELTYFDSLPLNKQQVVASLHHKDERVKEIQKQRAKIKKQRDKC